MGDRDTRRNTRRNSRRNTRRIRGRRQAVGMGVGALMGTAAELVVPALQGVVGQYGGVIWGAALGGILVSLPEFTASGAILTRSENRTLNIVVGLGIPAVLLGLVYVLLRLF